jgi:hypothetical protein
MRHRDAAERVYRHLFAGLAEPRALLDLEETDWDALLPLARSMRLFSRLAALARSQGLLDQVPPKVAGHMTAVLRFAAHRQQKILWELYHLERALRDIQIPVVVLKGTGYLMADLWAARGRIFGDVDLLVPREGLAEVERVLRTAGWRSDSLSAHDERYYREWMHEIPPLRHPERQIEVDIHHTLSPLTSRLKVDAVPFFATAAPVEGHRFRVLAPADRILHSAVHLFYGGEFEHGLRDLSDLDLLMREFGHGDPEFWPGLAARAEALNLGRPLFYALRYTRRLLATPVPEDIRARAETQGSGRTAIRAMDALFEPALMPADPAAVGGWAARARWLLWLRSHLLKMPPGLLLYHALRKAGAGRKNRT